MKLWVALLLSICATTSANSQNSSQLADAQVPILEAAAIPTYPAIWRAAHITGKVEVLVGVKAGRVVTVDLKSGEQYLFETTAQNVRTWRFAEDVNAAFSVTYRYEMTKEESDGPTNPIVEILPSLDVRITASPVKPTINY